MPEEPTGRLPTEAQHVARGEAAEADRATLASEARIDQTHLGQRRVNLIWEVTQAFIALMVSGVTLVVSALVIERNPTDTASTLLLSNAFFLIIGFYFGRTNHERTGGTGYEGR
jgi:hypothetical protein